MHSTDCPHNHTQHDILAIIHSNVDKNPIFMFCVILLTRVVKLLFCAYYYYYYYCFIYLSSLLLLLLLLRHIFKQPITFTIIITITPYIQTAYYYYYYFPDYYYYYYYYFPFAITFLLLLNQRNTKQADYKVIFKEFYYFHCITHLHRHITTDNIL